MGSFLEAIQTAVLGIVEKTLEGKDINDIKVFLQQEATAVSYPQLSSGVSVGVGMPLPTHLNTAFKPPRFTHIRIDLHLYDSRYDTQAGMGPMELAELLIARIHDVPIVGTSLSCGPLLIEALNPIQPNEASGTVFGQVGWTLRAYCSASLK